MHKIVHVMQCNASVLIRKIYKCSLQVAYIGKPRNKSWRNYKRLVCIISGVLSYDTFRLKLNFSLNGNLNTK